MELLNNQLIQKLSSENQSPCLSLYMPTHRSHPENLQDVIRFKNLVKQLEESLLQKYSSAEVQKHIASFKELENQIDLWNHTLDGLAVFGSTGLFKVVNLHNSVDELAMVADSFHTKPLRQILQSADHFHVLGLSKHDIRLFEGNRHSLMEVDLSDIVPKNINEAFGEISTEKHTTVASNGSIAGESSAMQHGYGGRKDETDKDTERFFRVVASEIEENYSKPTGWPLILAALPEHHHLFQKVNKNPLLLSTCIPINPTSVSTDKLADIAWEIMKPIYLQKIDDLSGRFEQARANGKGSDDYKEAALAAVEGRVETLLVEADRIIAVRITNLSTGNTQKKDMSNPRVDDLLDDMGELVVKMGGQVMVIPKEKMPTETGLAAIFRY